MGIQSNGGVPRVKTAVVDTAGRYVAFEALSSWVHLRAAAALRVFHAQADFDAAVNAYEMTAGELYSLPIEARGIWLKSVAGSTTATMTILHRKG
jgi:hypothetical protein